MIPMTPPPTITTSTSDGSGSENVTGDWLVIGAEERNGMNAPEMREGLASRRFRADFCAAAPGRNQ
jgi:hypothetical protein